MIKNSPDEAEILLVEDNEDDEELTLRALTKINLNKTLHVVRDGAEALDYIFATGAYSRQNVGGNLKLIMLDLKLPKVDGLEVLRRIKDDDRTKTIPVVMLTSSKEEPDIAASYKLGANSYIVKPVDFEGFIKTVSELGIYWLALNQPPR